jgi:hypothetical protein
MEAVVVIKGFILSVLIYITYVECKKKSKAIPVTGHGGL